MLHSLVLWARLPYYLQEGRIGVTECTTLALEEEYDHLVGVAGEG
jgi:hypothetical protein